MKKILDEAHCVLQIFFPSANYILQPMQHDNSRKLIWGLPAPAEACLRSFCPRLPVFILSAYRVLPYVWSTSSFRRNHSLQSHPCPGYPQCNTPNLLPNAPPRPSSSLQTDSDRHQAARKLNHYQIRKRGEASHSECCTGIFFWTEWLWQSHSHLWDSKQKRGHIGATKDSCAPLFSQYKLLSVNMIKTEKQLYSHVCLAWSFRLDMNSNL